MVIGGAVAGNAVLAATACGSDAAPCRAQITRRPGRLAGAALRAGRDLRRWPGSLRRSHPPTCPRPDRPRPGPRPGGAGPLPAPPATPSRLGRQGPGRPRCPPLLTGLLSRHVPGVQARPARADAAGDDPARVDADEAGTDVLAWGQGQRCRLRPAPGLREAHTRRPAGDSFPKPKMPAAPGPAL